MVIEKLHQAIKTVKDLTTGSGNAAPIVRHYPKDDQRRDAINMDAGFHIPGITDRQPVKSE